MDYAHWSPAGDKIVFTKQNGFAGTPQIFTINVNGTNLTQLTTAGSNSRPEFSPDGSKIAFIRDNSRIFTINANGTAQSQLSTVNANRLTWSPDGARLAIVSLGRYAVINADGTNLIQFTNSIGSLRISWGADATVQTPIGTNVNVTVGTTSLSFNTVSSGGTTTITPISSGSAGSVPSGFSIGGFGAFEINTTATYTPPITVCVTLPSALTQTQFNQLRFMHNENGTLVDRTSSRTFSTRRLCATVDSLSPFAIAEAIDPDLPGISGFVLDNNGDPLVGVSVKLTGTEERSVETDSDGAFSFVNLTPGGNYNVSPKQFGYLFTEYNQDFVDLTGERTVLFTGTASSFQIGGRVTDTDGNGVGGVSIELGGVAQSSVQTSADGNYVFTGLPADGSYILTASKDGLILSPPAAVVGPLTNDVSDIDFVAATRPPPTSAGVSIGGRALTPAGAGIANVRVSLADASGEIIGVAVTSRFGYYRFVDIPAGRTYVVRGAHRNYQFEPRLVTLMDAVENLDMLAVGSSPLLQESRDASAAWPIGLW
jgi:hypothetical protein